MIKAVRTLGQAIAIAAVHPEITSISMAAGSYGAATGEVFPYVVPSHVTVLGPANGPADGFAILVGNGTESAILLGVGKLKNLTFEDFAVAIVARDAGELENVRVQASAVAVREEATASLTVSGLDVTGASGACATGIDLIGDAVLTATDLTTRRLGTSLQVRDRSSASVSRATISGDNACVTNTFLIISSGTFALADSILFGSYSGPVLLGASTRAPLHASLTNVFIRDMRTSGLGGGDAIVRMTGGELSRTGTAGLNISSGSWSLTNVAITDNSSDGAYVHGAPDQEPVTLTMRGCTVTGNLDGVFLSDFAVVDLGTADSPGNNTLQFNRGVALDLSGEDGQREIHAAGNTWQPFVQGADNAGKYSATVIAGPVNFVNGNNFYIRTASRSIRF